jgi:hypothetical protein
VGVQLVDAAAGRFQRWERGDVNARCLDAGTVEAMNFVQTNGREWEKQYPHGRGEYA